MPLALRRELLLGEMRLLVRCSAPSGWEERKQVESDEFCPCRPHVKEQALAICLEGISVTGGCGEGEAP